MSEQEKWKKINGKNEAIKLLQGMNHLDREKLLKSMMEKDPSMTEFLRANLISFTDLRYLSVFMMNSFIKEIKPQTFALALRGMDDSFISDVMKNIPKRLAQDIQDILNGQPHLLREIEEARSMVTEALKKKIEKGEIIIKKDDVDVI